MNTTEVSSRGANRKAAAIVGVLYIIGTVAGVLSAVIEKPILNAADHLTAIATHEGQMIIATLLLFIMGVACAGIGLALYPIVKKYNEGLAIGSVGFRIMEGVLDIIGALSLVALAALSQEFVKAGAPQSSFYQTADVLINAGSSWLTNVAMLLTWCIGALMYYSVFYQYKLVPRWISGWGLVSFTLTIITCLFVMFRLIPGFGIVQVIANVPIGLQEMVFAVWLIAKGINPTAVPAVSAATATSKRLSAA